MNDSNSNVFEKTSIKPILYPVSLMMIVFYFVSFYPIFFLFNYSLISALFIYFICYFMVFIVSIFIYRHNSKSMEILSGPVFLGINSELATRRTGVPLIDILGLFITLGFSVVFFFIFSLHFLLPLFILGAIAFFMSLVSGKIDKWDVTAGRKTLFN